VSEQRTSERVFTVLLAGAVIGAVEVVLALAFASLVYGGYLAQFLAEGIGLYLLAGALTLALFAWRAGRRGVVGSIQDAAAAVLAVVAATTALDTFGSPNRAFLTVVAATVVVTLLTGVTAFALGRFRWGNLVRFVPYPVVGGFLAGTGWLLFKGGIYVATGVIPAIRQLGLLVNTFEIARWLPALAFGVLLLAATRIVKRPLVIPIVLALGLALSAVGILIAGYDSARSGLWMLGPFTSSRLWQPWTVRAFSGADWTAILGQAPGIATAVFVAIIAALFNMSGVELLLRRDLDANRELRDIGVANAVTSVFGGIPAYHALSLTSLAAQMGADARAAGLVAAIVPLGVLVFGASVVGLFPRAIVGGVLVFLGLGFMWDWLVVVRRSLPLGEWFVVLAIFATIVAKGLLAGVVIGLILAFALFVVNYAKIELVQEGEFGATYHSNVDRPAAERSVLKEMGNDVQILRVSGFVFFGTASGLLERIRKRVEAGPLRFLLIDLQRVTGMDSSAVMSFRKVAQLAAANRFEMVLSGARDSVRNQLQRGGFEASEGVARFEPDLDRGLQRCEEGLLRERGPAPTPGDGGLPLADLPPGLSMHFERRSLPEGAVLIHQGAPPDDLFVLESGRLSVEHRAPGGMRMRRSSMSPGVVVGEVGLYLGVVRTADVVAETPSVVLRLSRASLDEIERTDPELAAALHRWLAATLAGRLNDALNAFDALLD
jgi:sulfate permease, SulP family